VPVAAPESLERVQPYADKVVCLAAPPEFYAVGQFYREFPQVEDDEVARLLARAGRPHARAQHDASGHQPP
ncbi:MAG: phosphoribosyltransferase, partial [Burkholderiales bacterium]